MADKKDKTETKEAAAIDEQPEKPAEPDTTGKDIDQRMADLLKDHQEMGAR